MAIPKLAGVTVFEFNGQASITTELKKTVAIGFFLIVLPLFSGCYQQKQVDRADASSNPSADSMESLDPARAAWRQEKAAALTSVRKCELSAEKAIRDLEKRRRALAPNVKDGKPLIFKPQRLNRVARKSGCLVN